MCRQPQCEKSMEQPHSCKSGISLTPPMILAYLPRVKQNIETSLGFEDDLTRWPTTGEIIEEVRQIGGIAGPMMVAGLLSYGRAMTSMLFMGRLGELELAGGSLAIGFANITGYSVLSGLAMGMEPICGQAYGAKRWSLMGVTLQRTIMILLCACFPIGLLWINMERILLWCGQDANITSMAATYLLFSLPDLLAQSVLNPVRIYLRSQNITTPLTVSAAFALALHVPINLFLVCYLGLGIRGVALGAAWTDFNLVLVLLAYLCYNSSIHSRCWGGWSTDCFKEWRPLLTLAIPSCVSVCLEWWWYELMIIFSGLLINAKAAVATMGILIQTTSLVYIFPSSLSLAVSTRIGNELGANRPHKARIAMLVSLFCAVVVGILAMTFTTTMRHVWGWLFTADQSILSLTAMAMPIVGLCELGNCPQTTGCGVLRGSARPSTGANINLGSFYMVGMPVAMLLGFIFNTGLVGLWLGLLAAQATCAFLMLVVLLRTDWNLQALRAKQLTGSSSSSTTTTSPTTPNDTPTYRLDMDNNEKEALISIKVMQPDA